jgi:hypothetical protein
VIIDRSAGLTAPARAPVLAGVAAVTARALLGACGSHFCANRLRPELRARRAVATWMSEPGLRRKRPSSVRCRAPAISRACLRAPAAKAPAVIRRHLIRAALEVSREIQRSSASGTKKRPIWDFGSNPSMVAIIRNASLGRGLALPLKKRRRLYLIVMYVPCFFRPALSPICRT